MTEGLSEILNFIPTIPESIEYIKNLYQNSELVKESTLYGILVGSIFGMAYFGLREKNSKDPLRGIILSERREDADGEEFTLF